MGQNSAKKHMTKLREKAALRRMFASGEITGDETAVSVYREHAKKFGGHSVTVFRRHWNQVKNEMSGGGKFFSLFFLSICGANSN